MHETVAELAGLFGQPGRSVTPVPWNNSISEVGFAFPADYRDFVDLFGGGQIRHELAVHVPSAWPQEPGAPTGFRGFVWDTVQDGGIGDYLAGQYEEGNLKECPYPVYPEPGGLLIWGNTWNADQLFWLTDGEPDEWSVVVWYRQLAEWDRFDGGFGAFALALVTGAYPMVDELLPPRSPEVPDWETRYDWDHPLEGMVIEGWEPS
ncbi:hypothetical protein KGQ20_10065 [Catenulispora sp. NF23]|uniref:Knr4/Smi1-like domain-containing protein n=1 Tax=Catenulispora pinistramenti TaxID=2705254 RepID=A0ABS5KR81_9ACTN|nr:hypothetical protein [Catenulispora pinistramenti]MBS2533122.1 hypothetical protein [Catenulispora pinistramenti]MBS2548552.1 hypothetical protein [Catenulispora pinistramenti]